MLRLSHKASRRYLGMHGLLVQGMALIFVSFLLLSSARALVPGMCATQSALLQTVEDHPAGTSYWRAKSCCTLQLLGDAHEGPKAPTSGAPLCAFCNLAHAIVDEPVPVFFETPVVLFNEAIPAVDALLLSEDLDPSLRGRAPPRGFA